MNIIKRPMFFAAVVSCVAAAISLFIPELAFVIVALAVICFVVALVNKNYKYLTVILVLVLFAINLSIQFIQIKKISKQNGKKLTGTFLVVEELTEYDDFNSVTLKNIGCDPLPNNIKVLAFDYQKYDLKMGDIVNLKLKLSALDLYDEYRLSNYGEGVYATASILSLKHTKTSNQFYNMAGNIRKYVKQTLFSRFEGDTAGLLVALTTGDKTLLSDCFLGNIKTTGISHIVVVSGMHLAIIMTAVFWFLERFFYNKYVRCILSVLLVIFIYFVCGFTMSITRAGAMFIIVGFASIFNRDSDSLNSLMTAVVLVLIGTPFAIFNVSFQLSVLSTLAIIWVVPFYYRIIIERFNISSKILRTILNIVLCSIFAMFFTLPVTIKIFGYVSVISPITNLLVTYPVTLALVVNISALSVLPLIKIFAYPLFLISGFLSRFTVYVVNNLAKLPITVAVLPDNAFLWSILAIFIVILHMYFYEYKKEKK